MLDLQSRDVFVLISGDSDELCGGESEGLDQLLALGRTGRLIHFDDMDARLILVQADSESGWVTNAFNLCWQFPQIHPKLLFSTICSEAMW